MPSSGSRFRKGGGQHLTFASPLPLSARRLAAFASCLLLAILIVFAPVPYGAVLPAGQMTIEILAFGAAALAAAVRPARQELGWGTLPVAALGCLAALGLIQLLPLPDGALRRVAPLSSSVYATGNEILHVFGRGAMQSRISISPHRTLTTVLLVLAYAATFLAATTVATTRPSRRLLIGALFVTALFEVVYAAMAAPTPVDPYSERLHGTFVNPNHLAGYLQIALACAFGGLWNEILHSRQRAASVRDRSERFETRLLAIVLWILLWATFAAGIALTKSRGGILAATLTTLSLIFIAALRPPKTIKQSHLAAGIAIAVMAALLFVVLTVGNAPLLRFMASDPRDVSADSRTEIWRTSIAAWRTSPLLGDGLGAFRESFRRVQPASIHGLVEQAHNDFLQMLVTGGVAGAALVVIIVIAILVLLVRAYFRQSHREERSLTLAGFGAVLALTLHGLVEFNMSIPAIPVTLAAIAGVAWAAARAGRDPNSATVAEPTA